MKSSLTGLQHRVLEVDRDLLTAFRDEPVELLTQRP